MATSQKDIDQMVESGQISKAGAILIKKQQQGMMSIILCMTIVICDTTDAEDRIDLYDGTDECDHDRSCNH
ncbi:MAG: hypothetical protein V9G23_09065 [Giesbergeria sp.]